MRKIFTILFNSNTQYQIIKKKSSSASYFEFVKEFIIKIFGAKAIEFFNIGIEEAAFHLGSFIYPKYMIKCLNEEFGNDVALSAQEKADNQQKVLNIYYYSYKFSLERLQILINEPRIMMFVIYYAQFTKL